MNGNKLISDSNQRYYGETPGRLRRGPRDDLVRGDGKGSQRLGCFGRQAGFGGVAETRETRKRPEPGHRLKPDPSEKSLVTIPSERATNRILLCKGPLKACK